MESRLTNEDWYKLYDLSCALSTAYNTYCASDRKPADAEQALKTINCITADLFGAISDIETCDDEQDEY